MPIGGIFFFIYYGILATLFQRLKRVCISIECFPFRAMNIEPSGQLRLSVVTLPHSVKHLYKAEISIFRFAFKLSCNKDN